MIQRRMGRLAGNAIPANCAAKASPRPGPTIRSLTRMTELPRHIFALAKNEQRTAVVLVLLIVALAGIRYHRAQLTQKPAPLPAAASTPSPPPSPDAEED